MSDETNTAQSMLDQLHQAASKIPPESAESAVEGNDEEPERGPLSHLFSEDSAKHWGRVAVSLRSGGPVDPLFVCAWSWFIKQGMRLGDALIYPAVRMPAHVAANWIIDRFLDEEALQQHSSLLLVDDDMIMDIAHLERMRTKIQNTSFDVVSGLAVMRASGRPIILQLKEGDQSEGGIYDGYDYQIVGVWPEHETVPVATTGLAWTLVTREVLAAAREQFGQPLVEYSPKARITEDIPFMRKLRAVGAKIGVDTMIEVGHLGVNVMMPERTILSERDAERAEQYGFEVEVDGQG